MGLEVTSSSEPEREAAIVGPQRAVLDYKVARLWVSPPSQDGRFGWGCAVDHRRHGGRDVRLLGRGGLVLPAGLAGTESVVAQLYSALESLRVSLR